MQATESKDVLRVAEVALKLRCDVKTVYRLIERGRLKAVLLGERQGYRVAAAELERFLRGEGA
jgi:excisionase family DNA binding protein